MLTAVNLEELILAWHEQNATVPAANSEIRVSSIHRENPDEIHYAVEYGCNYLYRDVFIADYTEMLLWYINRRTGDLLDD